MAILPTDDAKIRILFTDYAIITDFLNLDFCSEHFINIKHRILATFNTNKKFNSDIWNMPLKIYRELTFYKLWMRRFMEL
jgi:hypothetical protein